MHCITGLRITLLMHGEYVNQPSIKFLSRDFWVFLSQGGEGIGCIRAEWPY